MYTVSIDCNACISVFLKRVKIGVLKHFEINEGVDIKSLPAENKEKIKGLLMHVECGINNVKYQMKL